MSYRRYRVEYMDCDGRWKGRDFTDLDDAERFFDSKANADCLGFVNYEGYYFIDRKTPTTVTR